MLRDTMWDEAVQAAGGDLHALVSVRDDLTARWGESHRGYHDLRHLDEVLSALQDLRAGTLDTDVEWAGVVLASWFHDAVYDVREAADNERRSAQLARTTLLGSGIGSEVVDLVSSLVLASEAHNVPETMGPQAAFHDADLWILGAPRGRFDEYCAAVRQEYAAVPEDAYAHGRAAILSPFLEREWVYRTERARRRWETVARRNLTLELTRLSDWT